MFKSRTRSLGYFVFVITLLLFFISKFWILKKILLPNESAASHMRQISTSLMLSSEDLASKKKLAEAGDGKAAYLVYQHYSFGLGEKDNAAHWLKMSVEAGCPYALEAEKVLSELRGKKR